MSRTEQIRAALRKLAGEVGPVQSILAKVKSVDEAEKTCVLIDDDELEIFDVRLSPVINDLESVTMFPEDDSWVLAVRIEDDEDWMVVAADKIYKYRIVVGNLVFEMSGNKFLLKKGDEDFKKLMSDLLDAMLSEKHMTNTGITIQLSADSQLKYNELKQRFINFLQ